MEENAFYTILGSYRAIQVVCEKTNDYWYERVLLQLEVNLNLLGGNDFAIGEDGSSSTNDSLLKPPLVVVLSWIVLDEVVICPGTQFLDVGLEEEAARTWPASHAPDSR